MSAEHNADSDAPCICPPDYCLGAENDTGSTAECSACLALDPEEGCLQEGCAHDWMLRPESDTYECLICGDDR